MQRSNELDLEARIREINTLLETETELFQQAKLRLELADLYKKQGNDLAALDQYLQISEWGIQEANVTKLLSALRFKMNLELNRYKVVRESLQNRQQIAMSSSESETRFRLLYLEGLRLSYENLDGAIDQFKQAKRILTDSLQISDFERCFFFKTLGTLLARQHKADHEAVGCFTRAIDTGLAKASVYAARGVVNCRIKEIQQAEEDFNQGVERAKKAREALTETSFIHPEVKNLAEKNKKLLLEQEVYVRLTRAAFYVDKGENENAIKDYSYVLRLEGVRVEYKLICLMNLKEIDCQVSEGSLEPFIGELAKIEPKDDIQNAVLGLAQLSYSEQTTEELLVGLQYLTMAISCGWLPFHLMRDSLIRLSNIQVPERVDVASSINEILKGKQIKIMKRELLGFAQNIGWLKLEVSLILRSLDEKTMLNHLLSIPTGMRSTAISRGSFENMVQRLEELHKHNSPLVSEMIADFPFSKKRKEELERAYPWISDALLARSRFITVGADAGLVATRVSSSSHAFMSDQRGGDERAMRVLAGPSARRGV